MDKAEYEQEMIQGFLAGKPEAYRTVDNWVTTVLNLRGWHASIHEARDDIKQETLIALTENLRNNKYKGMGLKTYVSSITKFLCLKAYDRRPVEPLDGKEISDNRPPELDLMIQSEEHQFVRNALLQLNDKCRKMLALRYYRDMDHSQIARIMKVTAATSRQWLKRCLDKARELAKNDISL